MKKVKHSVSCVHMPFAFCNIFNWYEDGVIVETTILTDFESLCLMDIIEESDEW